MEARLEVAKEDKVEVDKVLAAQHRRVARAGAASAGREEAADAGTGGQEVWHGHGEVRVEHERRERERREVERREEEKREKRESQ